MNINRHNYEDFFLLYVDQELTAAERVMVETFVATNPDLKNELELLQQSIFTADAKLDESFKNNLLRPVEESAITEEQLLLHLDDELSMHERETVSKAIASSTELQKQMQWLQRSKLSADTSIVFPDKSLLYKEAQPARILYMSTAVRRWSAAAAILLMLGTGYWLLNRNNNITPVAGVQPAPAKTEVPAIINKAEAIAAPAPKNELVQQQGVEKNNSLPAVKQKPSVITPAVEKRKNDAIAVQAGNQKQTQQPLVQQPENQTTVDVQTTAKTELPLKNNSGNISNNPTTSSVQPETSTAKTNITYVNNDGWSNEDEQSGFLNENRQRSTGLKGLLKKAKRTLERRTGIQSGDSQVRFAVFAVNTQ
jgi:hypothetical protein